MIFFIPKKLREPLGAYKKLLAKTSSTEKTFTSQFNLESAIEAGVQHRAPWMLTGSVIAVPDAEELAACQRSWATKHT